MCERRQKFDEELFLSFMELKKAFDRVNWTKFFVVLDWKERRHIMDLYMQHTSVVRTENRDSQHGEIGLGVRR